MESGGARIQEVELYECGYCTNNVAHVLAKEEKKLVDFPALVVRMKHRDFGTILFDTGYSRRIYKNGWKSRVYNLINPTFISDKDTILNKLRGQGIVKIDKVILSHPHPDHIGGLKDFTNYDLIATKEVFEQLKKKRVSNLVFENQVPDSFNRYKIKKYIAKELTYSHFLQDYFKEVYNLLGDGSILGVRLDGHTKGQMGIFLPEYNLLFAADASWGGYFANRKGSMRLLPRLLQNRFSEYKKSIDDLARLKKDHKEIKIVFTHEKPEVRRKVMR